MVAIKSVALQVTLHHCICEAKTTFDGEQTHQSNKHKHSSVIHHRCLQLGLLVHGYLTKNKMPMGEAGHFIIAFSGTLFCHFTQLEKIIIIYQNITL